MRALALDFWSGLRDQSGYAPAAIFNRSSGSVDPTADGSFVRSHLTEVPTMDLVSEVREVLRDVLQLGDSADALDGNSALLGALPELDSLAVASVMVGLEERLGFVIDDSPTQADFETLGSLARFAEQQM